MSNKYSQWLMNPWGLFLAYFLATLIKAPLLFKTPRLWAEEGVVYFLQARTLGLGEALWGMPLGYLSFPANLAGVLSAQLPLLYAPYGSLTVSLLVQMLLFWVVLANRYFEDDRLKQGVLLLIPVLVIQSAETWLNAINSQFWLALAASYVLASPAGTFSLNRHSANGVALLMAGLSGPVSAFLAPLFVLRGLIERRWVWLAYALPVSIGALIVLAGPSAGARDLSFPVDVFAFASFFHVVANNLCVVCALSFFPYADGLRHYYWLALLLVLGIYGWVFLRANQAGRWLILASFALLVLSFVGMFGKELFFQAGTFSNSRYFFAPAALFFAALLSGQGLLRQGVARWALVLLAVNGVLFAMRYPAVGERDGTSWQKSVDAYLSHETDVVYFSSPFCGFVPELAGTASFAPDFITVSAFDLLFKLPDHATRHAQNIYLYRARQSRPHVWQRHDGVGWRDSGMFLFGTHRFGQCQGGDRPDPVRWARIANGKLHVNRAELGHLDGHTFLLGYGENFGAMLARRSFIQFNGDDLEPRLPPVDVGRSALEKTEFTPALINGVALDTCAKWGGDCGAPAADAYCMYKGFDYALGYKTQLDSPPTRIISSGQLCESPECDRIVSVKCARQSAIPPMN